jgi:hypothetical protein
LLFLNFKTLIGFKMSYDEEDERRYLGYSTMSNNKRTNTEPGAAAYVSDSPPPRQGGRRVTFTNNNDEDDEPRRKPVPRKKQRPVLLEEEDDEEDDQGGGKPSFTKLLASSGKQLTMTATRKPQSNRKISTRDKLACETLVAHADAIRMTNNTREELMLLLQCTDEGAIVDPLITLYKSVSTGTCNIYVKETIPLSVFLMALVLKATFFVQVTGKAKTPEETFDTVAIKPFKKNADEIGIDGGGGAQPFGIEKAVQDKLELRNAQDLVEQVVAYMHVVGPISSMEACDGEFIETHIESVKKIFSGDLVLVKQQKQESRMKLEEDEE